MTTSNPGPQAKTTLAVLTASLREPQIEWLNERADQDDVSIDRLVRQFIDAARTEDRANSDASSGAAASASGSTGADTMLARLRKAKKTLDSLSYSDEETEKDDRAVGEEASPAGPASSGETGASDASSEHVGGDTAGGSPRSMFDFISADLDD